MMTTEKMRNQRRDKKMNNKKFAPRVGGLPKGFPRGYWPERQKAKGVQ